MSTHKPQLILPPSVSPDGAALQPEIVPAGDAMNFRLNLADDCHRAVLMLLQGVVPDIDGRLKSLESRVHSLELTDKEYDAVLTDHHSDLDDHAECIGALEKRLAALQDELRENGRIVGVLNEQADEIAEALEETQEDHGKALQELDDRLTDLEAQSKAAPGPASEFCKPQAS